MTNLLKLLSLLLILGINALHAEVVKSYSKNRVFQIVSQNKDSNKSSLKEDEIDRIFTTFMEEKNKKKEDALKKAEQDKINLERALSKKANQDIIEETIDLMDATAESNVSNFISTPIPFTIYGTSCLKGKCTLITSAGEFKKGSRINLTGEVIEKITKSFVETNLRKISL